METEPERTRTQWAAQRAIEELKAVTKGDAETVRKVAQGLMEAYFYETVEDIVATVKEEAEPGDDISDRVFQECDTACIYTADIYAYVCGAPSDAMSDETGSAAEALHGGDIDRALTILAFDALRCQVESELSGWEPEDREAEEDAA